MDFVSKVISDTEQSEYSEQIKKGKEDEEYIPKVEEEYKENEEDQE